MAPGQDRKSQLAAELSQARAAMHHASGGVREGANVSKRFKQSVSGHKIAWLAGAALLGLILARRPKRPKKVYFKDNRDSIPTESVAKVGLAAALTKLALDIARPIALRLIMERATPWVESYMKRRYSRE